MSSPTTILPSPNHSMAVSKRTRNIEYPATKLIPHWNSQIHGENVQIAGQHQAYRKPDCNDQAYVFFSQSLKLGWKTTLEVIEVTAESWENLVYGVTSCNPASLKQSELPKDSKDLMDRPEYWIVKYDKSFYQKRDLITFGIDLKGKVFVSKNHCKFASFHVDPTQPIWLFFNMVGWVSGLRIISSSCTYFPIKISPIKRVEAPGGTVVEDSPLPESSNQQASSECVICCEGSVNCVLYRCGHMCMCYDCSSKMWQPGTQAACPICRKEILDVIKIYK